MMPIANRDDSIAKDKIYLHLDIRTSPEKRDLLREFFAEAVPFYESAGGLKVRLLQDASDPDAFVELIEYESQQYLDRDNRRIESDPEMKRFIARWRTLLEKVEAKTYLDVTSRIRT